MFFSSWLRKRKSGNGRIHGRSVRARIRPQLEVLEDRTVPTVFNVTTPLDIINADDGLLSLREAVLQANASQAPDTIVLSAGVYALAIAGSGEDNALTGDLDLTGQLNIRGAGAGFTFIDGAGLDRIFDIREGAKVTISDVTIQGGAESWGGAISNLGDLTIRDATLTGNSAEAGGAIYNAGFDGRGGVTIQGSTLSNNTAVGGGAIFSEYSTYLTINGSTLSGNSAVGGGFGGGAIYNSGSEMSITDSSLLANHTDGPGGAIYTATFDQYSGHGNHWLEVDQVVSNCTLADNSADYEGGAIYIYYGSHFTINHCTFTHNSSASAGGGIYVNYTSGFTNLTMNDCTLTSNSASSSGGAIGGIANMILRSTTISGNSAAEGGGIYAGAFLTLDGSVVTDNTAQVGGDIFFWGFPSWWVSHGSDLGDVYFA